MSRGNAIKLTDARIKAMKEGEVLSDAIYTGLTVTAGLTGKSFKFRYTTHGGVRRNPQIGKYGLLDLEAAQAIAKEWAEEVARGGDPSLTKQQARESGPPATLKDLQVRWDEELAKAKKRQEGNVILMTPKTNRLKLKSRDKDLAGLKDGTLDLYSHLWKHILFQLGEDTSLNSITEEDVEKMRDEIAHGVEPRHGSRLRGGPVSANRSLAFLCNIMNWAIEWKMRDAVLGNPTLKVSHYEERHRERYLSAGEMKSFFDVADGWLRSDAERKKNFARLALLCLLNGTRRGEFMGGRLQWVDFERSVYVLPDSKTGSKEVVLGDEALAILNGRREEWVEEDKNDPKLDWIIYGDGHTAPLTNPKKMWALFLTEAGIEGLHLHDLRHTFATIALSLGYGLDQIGAVLGHSSGKITSRYAHRMIEPTRKLINETVKEMRRLAEDSGKEKKEVA